MSYKNILIYILVSGLFTPTLWAQDTRYRVEVLVLTHLNSVEPATKMNEIRDYSSALDFLTPVEEPEEEENVELQEDPVDTTVITQQEDTSGESAIAEEAEQDPNEVVHHEEMSDVMREAWRRLRLSAPFRPQQYLSWEQGDQEPFPVLRVHDLEVILVKDPLARERLRMIEADLLESESEKQLELVAGAPSTQTPQIPVDDPMTAEEPEMPGPTQYYRLDGTVMLRRSRFLHVDLDLQMRDGIWEPEPLEIVSMDPVIYERAGPTSFLVHELVQSRQVKTERMEYFDGPMLSVLTFITAIELDSEDASP